MLTGIRQLVAITQMVTGKRYRGFDVTEKDLGASVIKLKKILVHPGSNSNGFLKSIT